MVQSIVEYVQENKDKKILVVHPTVRCAESISKAYLIETLRNNQIDHSVGSCFVHVNGNKVAFVSLAQIAKDTYKEAFKGCVRFVDHSAQEMLVIQELDKLKKKLTELLGK